MSTLIEEDLHQYIFCSPLSLGGATDIVALFGDHDDNSSEVKSYLDSLTDRDKLAAFFKCRMDDAKSKHISQHKLLGVVVEFGVETGVDAFAAYSDGVVYWYDSTLSKMLEVQMCGVGKDKVDEALLAATKIADASKPSFGIPNPPQPGFALIALITEDGIYYGLGASRDLASSPISAPIIKSALQIRKDILSSRPS